MSTVEEGSTSRLAKAVESVKAAVRAPGDANGTNGTDSGADDFDADTVENEVIKVDTDGDGDDAVTERVEAVKSSGERQSNRASTNGSAASDSDDKSSASKTSRTKSTRSKKNSSRNRKSSSSNSSGQSKSTDTSNSQSSTKSTKTDEPSATKSTKSTSSTSSTKAVDPGLAMAATTSDRQDDRKSSTSRDDDWEASGYGDTGEQLVIAPVSDLVGPGSEPQNRRAKRTPTRTEPVPTVGHMSAGDHQTVSLPSTVARPSSRGAHRRARVRRVTRVVRHIDPWSAFKVGLIFSLVGYVVCLTSGVLLWRVAQQTGTLDNMQGWFTQFGWETFELDGGEIFRNAWILGLFLAVGFTGLIVLAVTLFNLVSDIVGGVRVSVLEEEVVERRLTSSRRYAVRRPGIAPTGSTPRGPDWSVDHDVQSPPLARRSPGAMTTTDWSVDD